jgi:hypothetical protein
MALRVETSASAANNEVFLFGIGGLTNGFRMRQDSTSKVVYSFEGGNLGIGTSTPAAYINTGAFFRPEALGRMIDVYSANNEAIVNLVSNQNTDAAHLGGLYFSRSAGQADGHVNVAGIQARQSGTGLGAGADLFFFTKGVGGAAGADLPVMAIKSYGFVGIGTTLPGAMLSIAKPGAGNLPNVLSFVSGRTYTFSMVNDIDSTGGADLKLSGGDNKELMYWARNGLVGIGTTNPGYRLQVGNAGDGSEARANSWAQFSDARLKTNLVKLTGAIDKIELLNGYYFNWNQGADKKKQIGVIAQEVEKVVPEVVSEGSDGYKSVEYSKLAPLFIEAFKEQQAKIKQLESQIDELQKRIK